VLNEPIKIPIIKGDQKYLEENKGGCKKCCDDFKSLFITKKKLTLKEQKSDY